MNRQERRDMIRRLTVALRMARHDVTAIENSATLAPHIADRRYDEARVRVVELKEELARVRAS